MVARAKRFLGPSEGKRSGEDLQRLWRALVDELGPDSAPDPPAPSDETPAPPQDDSAEDPPSVDPPNDYPEDELEDAGPGNAVAAVEEIVEVDPVGDTAGLDLDELIDASSHTDQVVELLAEAFPGAEIDAPSPARADQ